MCSREACHYTMASRKRQYEELSDDSDADTVILTDDEETDESDDETDDTEDIKDLVRFFKFTALHEQVCVDVKTGMSQEDVIAKYKSQYLKEMDVIMEKVLEGYVMLKKLKIFIHMCDTNDHLEQIRGDTDEYWVEAYNIHKKKFLHPQLEPYIIHHIKKCAEEDVAAGYTSKYFQR